MELRGTRVVLRTTTERDLRNLMTLWNDGRVMRWVGFPNGLGYDAERITRWFQRMQDQADRHHFVVRSEPVGFCGEVYYVVDRARARAVLDIKFVPEAQGRRLATDALQRLIRHIFETEPEVNVVWTEPSEENQAARRLYARCGLKPQPRPTDLGLGTYWVCTREDWSRNHD